MSQNNYDIDKKIEKLEKPKVKTRKPWYMRYKIPEIFLAISIVGSAAGIGYTYKEEIGKTVKNTSNSVIEYFDLLEKEREKVQEKQNTLLKFKEESEDKIQDLKLKFKSRESFLEKRLSEKNEIIDKYGDKLGDYKREIDKYETAIKSYKKEVATARSELADIVNNVKDLNKNIDKSNKNLNKRERTKRNLEDWALENRTTFSIKDYEIFGQEAWIAGNLLKDGDYGRILYSSDYGKIWTLKWASKNSNYPFEIEFFNKSKGWIATTDYLLYTENKGKNWKEIVFSEKDRYGRDRNLSIQDFGLSDQGYLQVLLNNGICYNSFDNGKTWEINLKNQRKERMRRWNLNNRNLDEEWEKDIEDAIEDIEDSSDELNKFLRDFFN